MFFFSKTRSLLGIDIGTSYIKAVQLKRGAGKPILENYGLVNVVYPIDSQIKFDAVKQTAEILIQLYQRAGFTTKQAVLSIPSNIAFVSILTLPPMPEPEMEKSIEYQAKKYIPLSISDVNLGWQILDDIDHKSFQQKDVIPRVKVLLTAVPKNVIKNYLQVSEMAGLEVKALEIESLSMIRSLITPEERGGVLIVDIGAKATILSFVYQGYLFATRHLTIGGDSITTSIANSMGINFERADQMKRNIIESQAFTSPAQYIVRNMIGIIKNEIQQFIRMTEDQNRVISKIILTGGGSKMVGLPEALNGLAGKIEYGNPLLGVSFSSMLENKLSALAPQLSVSIGLAMRRDIKS
jgi:type IV pilus assembly protein PilM